FLIQIATINWPLVRGDGDFITPMRDYTTEPCHFGNLFAKRGVDFCRRRFYWFARAGLLKAWNLLDQLAHPPSTDPGLRWHYRGLVFSPSPPPFPFPLHPLWTFPLKGISLLPAATREAADRPSVKLASRCRTVSETARWCLSKTSGRFHVEHLASFE